VDRRGVPASRWLARSTARSGSGRLLLDKLKLNLPDQPQPKITEDRNEPACPL
jgi:hypothetical protein